MEPYRLRAHSEFKANVRTFASHRDTSRHSQVKDDRLAIFDVDEEILPFPAKTSDHAARQCANRAERRWTVERRRADRHGGDRLTAITIVQHAPNCLNFGKFRHSL